MPGLGNSSFFAPDAATGLRGRVQVIGPKIAAQQFQFRCADFRQFDLALF